MTTINELDLWMTENCYNDNYAIGNRSINEGLGLEKVGNLFIWFYTERGQKENLKYFPTEKEAVEFAFEQIRSDQFANRHMVGFLSTKEEELLLLAELRNRNINHSTDVIPYDSAIDNRYRVFVFGCDIQSVTDLMIQYAGKY